MLSTAQARDGMLGNEGLHRTCIRDPLKVEAAPLGSSFTDLMPLLELRHVQSDETLQETETFNLILDECTLSFITFRRTNAKVCGS